jgi:CDP-paratose 2-epimerase
MKILVTGGCGFLGSHIGEYYRSMGDEVVAYDNLTKFELSRTGYQIQGARSYNESYLKSIGVKVLKGDIRDKDTLMGAAKDCDFIAHTAAQPAMTIAIENPELDITSNVMGTFNVLDVARRYDLPVVSCSSIHVYGNGINDELTEGETRFTRYPPVIDESCPTMTGSLSPLHASKRTGELYLQAFTDTYGLKAATYRLSGMYGPRQFGGEDHGWVANFAIRTILGLPIKVFGTDKQVRDILYARDAVRAIDAFYKNQYPGIYNVGGGIRTSISIRECLELIKNICAKEQNISFEPARHGDLWYFISDISKANGILGWEPEVLPDEGIQNLITWIDSVKQIFGA